MTARAQTSTEPLVLYVDDERGNRVVFEQSLASDFRIVTAADPVTALKLLEELEVAVVVTDMRMPSMSGEELLRIVKERWPSAIRMVVTAYSDIDPILRAINEGLVARYIIKPWMRAELAQVLRWATEAWQLGRNSAAVHRRLLETERLATLGSVSSMLVHDLNQPLMSLVTDAEILEELGTFVPLFQTALDPANQSHRRAIELLADYAALTSDVKRSIEHVRELVTSLRGFNQRRSSPTDVSTDPLPILRHAMSVCHELTTQFASKIDYDGPQELPHVRMPATELTQVMINLVANGAQAVAARGEPNGRIAIKAISEHNMLVLEVKDSGVGMSAEVLKRVGTPFFTTRDQGTGLGVAQCQRLVGTSGGRMSIASEVGVGTTVTITLPISI